MFQNLTKLLLVVLYINAFQYSNSTLIDHPASKEKEPALLLDDFGQWQNSLNVLEGNRIISSAYPQQRGNAILSSAKDFLTEYLPTDYANNNYSLLRITYSTTRLNTKSLVKNRVGMVLRPDHPSIQSYYFDWNLQKGQGVKLDLSIPFLVKLAHEFRLGSGIGIIIRGPLKIHQIELLTAENGEADLPFHIPASDDDFLKIVKNWPLLIKLPTTRVIPASIVKDNMLVIDDFSQWQYPTNAQMGNRIISSTNLQHRGLAILSFAKDYLIEYIHTEYAKMTYSSLRITYSTTGSTGHASKHRVGMVLRTDSQRTASFFFDWNLQRGKRVELNISIEFLIQLAHEFQIDANLGIIIRGPLKIHRIELLTPNYGETEIPIQIPESNVDIKKIVQNRRLFIELPTTRVIAASNLIEPELVLDDFSQWQCPTNVRMGYRVIVSEFPQHQGLAILPSNKDQLMEYFPNELANRSFSSLRITFSTTKWNGNNSITDRVGMIQRSDDQEKRPFFFGGKLRRGVQVGMRIPINFLKNIWSEFRIDCNHGIIIRGPIKIHRIELLAADREAPDITFEKPGFYLSPPEMDGQSPGRSDSEIANHVLDLSPFDLDIELVNQFLLSEPEIHEGDLFPSHSDIMPHINTITQDNWSHEFNLKYTQFLNILTQLRSNKAFLLDVHDSNVLRGSFQKMNTNINTFRMQFGVRIQSDMFDGVSPNTNLYFELLHNEILAFDNQLFEQAGNMMYRIIPKRYVDPGVLDYYRFVGRAIGMGIMNEVIQLTKFVPMVYKILLNKPILHSDLVQSYPSLLTDIEQALKFASSNPENMSMSIPKTERSAHTNFIDELIHNSKSLMFIAQDTDEYVSALLWEYVQVLIGAQAEALCNGLHDVIPNENLAVFDEHEFVHILMGCPEGMSN